ncbi:MAG: hypothetical protein GWN84_02040, partial [Gammaproteobacteria bacterium]|nr:hypothetical protein [Gammaproteobacteria bacterium]
MRAMLRSGAEHTVISADEREQLECRLAAAETWQALWRRGRGRPVDRAALEDSDAVSDIFMTRVTELAGEVGGDARALLLALEEGRIAHFRTNT